MDSPRNVTIYKIAEVSGYSPSTVSQALRGTGSIKAATREKIRKIADELGYRPDPVFSALVSARGRRKEAGVPILVLQQGSQALPPWLQSPFIQECEHLGYAVDVRQFSDSDKPTTLLRVAWNRGVQIVVVNRFTDYPCFFEESLWKNFVVLACGDYPHRPPFHHVRGSCIDSYDRLREEVTRRGYRRPGWIVRIHQNPLSLDNTRIGLAHAFQYQLSRDHLLEPTHPLPLILPFEIPRDQALSLVKNWLERMRPDCVLATTHTTRELLLELGITSPGDVGFACEVTDSQTSGTGLNQEEMPRQIARLADNLFRHRVYGVQPASPVLIMPQTWNEGVTLRAAG